MKQMKWKLVAVLGSIAAIIGCDSGWNTGGDAITWDDSYGFANFSGTYRGVNGNTIVFNFSAGSLTGTSSSNGTEVVTTVLDTQTAVFPFLKNPFASDDGGTAMDPVIVPGTVKVTAGGITANDTSTDGIISGTGLVAGTVDYNTGAWNLNFSVPPTNGTVISATYSREVGTVTSSSGDDDDGSTGAAASETVYTFTINQLGNSVTITDSNGDTYTGLIDGLDFTRGDLSGSDGEALDGPVVATITLTGTSRGMGTTLVLTLSGNLSDTSLLDRTVQGVWIEDDGDTADVFGQAPAIAVTDVTTTIDDTATTN